MSTMKLQILGGCLVRCRPGLKNLVQLLVHVAVVRDQQNGGWNSVWKPPITWRQIEEGMLLDTYYISTFFHIYTRFLTHSLVQFDIGFSLFAKWISGFSWPRRCLGSIFVAFLLAPATTPLQVGGLWILHKRDSKWKDRSLPQLPGSHEHFSKESSCF